MGVKFRSPLELSGHRSILHTDVAQTLVVKVVTKTTAHPEYGNGSSDGYTIDGVEGAYLEFTPGNTYKFDQSDSSNSGHPLRFYEDAAKTTAYTTGVTTSGTAGSSGAYTQIIPTISTPPVLFYQCSAHSLMGSYVKFGTATAASSNTTYTINSVTSGNDAIIRLTGSDATTDDVTLAAGSNITITETGDTITLSSESTDQVRVACKNTSGSTITKGTPVYVTGSVGASAVVTIAPANAASASTMPASGLLLTDLANNGEGHIVTGGVLKNLVTSPIDGVTPSANATLYVKSGGGLTTTKPTGTALIQNVGKVGRVSTTADGSILVSSILRSNDIPNIQQGYIWLGDSNGVPVASSHVLSTLTDVSTTTPTTGQVLKYDGTQWAPGTDSAGAGASNSFETIAISGQSSVVAESATDTLNLVAGNNITLTTNASTDTITIASSASASSQLNVEKNILTGDGSTVTFSVSSSIISENNTQVYIDGVYQSKDNYSASGSNITFSTAPPNGAEIEVIHFVSVQGVIRTDTFTGDNSTVAFTVGTTIIDENNTQIYIDGVYQSKNNYTVSGSTITFSTAPPTSAAIEVVHIKAAGISTINDNQFTGDGSTVAFTLSQGVTDENNTFVFINGVYQDKSTYSIAGAILTFSTAPQNGYTIEVMQVGEISIKANALTTDNFTGDGSTVAYTLTVTPASLDAVDVYISGLRQNKSTLSLSTNTLTFSTAPPNGASIEVKTIGDINTSSVVAAQSITGGQGIDVAEPSTNNFTISNRYDVSVISTATTAQAGYVYVLTASLALTLPAGVVGDSIKISNRSATTTCTVVPDGTDKIMGSNTTLTLDTASASFELIFSGTAEGWVIIGQ